MRGLTYDDTGCYARADVGPRASGRSHRLMKWIGAWRGEIVAASAGFTIASALLVAAQAGTGTVY